MKDDVHNVFGPCEIPFFGYHGTRPLPVTAPGVNTIPDRACQRGGATRDSGGGL